MNMIEKVAEAIYESRRVRENRGSVTFAKAVKHRLSAPFTYMVVEDCRHAAKAAIEAMRDPTEDVLDAAMSWHDHVDADENYPMARGVIRAAVGAALEGK